MRLPWDVRLGNLASKPVCATNAPNLVVFTTFATFCQCINLVLWNFTQFCERFDRFLEAKPMIADDVYVAPNATVLGKVSIGSGSSVWFQSVIRADINEIRIGSETNIQDGSILHVADRYGLTIGDQVCCGHRAILHACTIGDRVLIGMGAIVMDGAEVGDRLDCWGGCVDHQRDPDPAWITGPGFSGQGGANVDTRRAEGDRRACREVCGRREALRQDSNSRSSSGDPA